MSAANGTAFPHSCDLGDFSSHESLIRNAIERFGTLDILVNNAAIQKRQPFLDATLSTWTEMFAVNLQAPFFLSQAAARHMTKQRRGKIVNIASIHDTVALSKSSIYSITKGGLRMLTRSLALELSEYNVHVNAISPGAIRTNMNRAALADPAHEQDTLKKIPLGRIGDPQDLVGAAVFLASSESDYITGSTLYVDGGILLQ
ncbi:MAG: SDR family oxidoreductase [Acidobacteriaceae bacterium]|nr:SDR family oxidoreductase [Acidobacteriaceae bacterium]